MTRDARELLVKLMAEEMYSLLRDANTLQSGLLSSQTPYLLKLLAFEIGLKCCCVIEGLEPQPSHDYLQIFTSLPADVQTELRQAAALRMGPHADWSDFGGLLSLWSKNFTRLRYPYEAYKGLTESEFKSQSASWLAGGAREQDAVFVFRPMELDGLLDALLARVEGAQQSASAGVPAR